MPSELLSLGPASDFANRGEQLFLLLLEVRENERLKRAKCAIHTMIDEHFGISLLEYLEAKVPVVCHRSGGPEMDILLPEEKFGFLASDEDEFTAKVLHVLTNFESNEIKQKRIAGFNSLSRFLSDDAFGKHFAKTFL